MSQEKTENKHDASLSLIIDDKEYHWYEKNITGLQIRNLADLPLEKELFLIKSETGETEQVKDDYKIDLTQPGIERFGTKKKYHLIIDEKRFEWESKLITGSQLKLLGSIPDGYRIFYYLKDSSEPKQVADSDTIDLSTHGIDRFYSEMTPISDVIIGIDGKTYQIQAGSYSVSQIKEIGKINPAYDLEQLIDGKLTPLDENETVQIIGDEQFFSHVKDGSSSDHTTFPESELNELRLIAPSLSIAEEGGYNYILINNLKLPDGCSPSITTALLCIDPKGGYQSRLYFESVIAGKTSPNWTSPERILDRTWYVYSWRTNPGLRLVEKLMIHLNALRAK